MPWILDALLALPVAIAAHAAYRRARARRNTRQAIAHFTALPTLGTFEEAAPRVYLGARRYPRAVLLVHGFSACAGAFKHLLPELERRGIPYYAPNLTGFGLDDTHLLETARVSDWRRDVDRAYELLAGLADEVSVVGHSYGTLLASELACERPVRELVLIAPYFFLKSGIQQRMRRLVNRPGVAWLFRQLFATFEKPARPGRASLSDLQDPAAGAGIFSYRAMPLQALFGLWGTPRPNLAALRAGSLTILYGAHERTSDVPPLLAELDAGGIPYRAIAFANSGHHPLDDFDREEAVQAVLDALGLGSLPGA